MDEYFIYLRKSRADMEAEAHGEGETLARHERALLELAKRLHLNVTQIYREVVSGETIAARPVMQRILSEVEQGVWAGGLVMEIERLARGDTIDQGIIAKTFKFSDTKIITPMKIYDPNNEYDEEYFEFGLFMSRREYKVINRRLQRGKLAAAKEGKWVPCRAPYGYRRIKLKNEKGWSLEPVEEEADVVRLIFQLYTRGAQAEDGSFRRMPLGAIARHLDDLGIPSPQGGLWGRPALAAMVQNPAYIGKVRWGQHPSKKKVVDGKVVRQRVQADADEVHVFEGRHPAIIEQEVFDIANEMVKRRVNSSTHIDLSVKNPLTRVVFCACCGHAMGRATSAARPDAGSLVCRTHGCPTVSTRLDIVEERILAGLTEWLSGYELEWTEANSPEHRVASNAEIKQKALQRAEGDLARLQKQLERTHDLLEQGVYDVDTFLDRSRSLAEKINAAKELAASLRQEVVVEEEREANRKNIIPKVKNLIEVYHSLPSAEEKNEMLKDVVEKVVYKKIAVPGKRLKPDDFEIEIYPRIPRK